MQAAVYCRISEDRSGAGLGVQRQEDDCRELAARRGWEVGRVYCDNDLSAYSGRERPAYRDMMEAVRDGHVDAVLAWHPDRLHRSPLELEEFISLVGATGCRVETVQAGSFDLSTPTGRAVARTVGAWARFESEHKAERLRRKHLELAINGKPAGGGRPFGYDADRMIVRPREAELIREAAERVLAGDSVTEICRDWKNRDIHSARGGWWRPGPLRKMLTSARISGRRERQMIEGKVQRLGTIVNDEAAWPPIITVDQSDALRSMFSERRQGRHPSYLLSGLVRCVHCGSSMVHRSYERPQYWCVSAPWKTACGRLRILAVPLEDLVSEAVLTALEGGALERYMSDHDYDWRTTHDELREVEEQLRAMAERYASGQLSTPEWEGMRAVWVNRQTDLRRRISAGRRALLLDDVPNSLRESWPAMSISRRRSIISLLVEAVIIHPSPPKLRGFRFRPDRAEIHWRA